MVQIASQETFTNDDKVRASSKSPNKTNVVNYEKHMYLTTFTVHVCSRVGRDPQMMQFTVDCSFVRLIHPR